MEQLLIKIGQNLFLVFGLMALGGAATMVLAKNAVHSVIGFLFAMLSMAGCYLTIGAEFMGVAQLLVYAGGIVVLFLFVVMLVELSKSREKGLFQRQTPFALVLVVAGAVAFVGVFWRTIFGSSAAEALTLSPNLMAQGEKLGNAQMLSRGLFAEYLLPFEILSVILLVALVGAVVLAKTERV
ncbi:MAG: NADH-quinone oxidoreductase subunit J [Holophaga sp.]|nr:NADH-quinone oxidoreductase subunit J [Holophaga sp.]